MILTHLIAFLNIALGHFVIIYTRKHVVINMNTGTKNNSITQFSKYPQGYIAQVVRKATINPYFSLFWYSQWFKPMQYSHFIYILFIIFIFLFSYTVCFIYAPSFKDFEGFYRLVRLMYHNLLW